MKPKVHVSKGALIPIIIGFLFSGVFLGVGVYLLTSNQDLDENGIHVAGTVTDLVQNRDSDGDNIYYPVVEFELKNGEVFSQQMAFGSSPPSYDVGDIVDIAYYDGDPDSATIMSTFSMYVFPGIFIGIGAFFELILMFVFIRVMKKSKKGQGMSTSSQVAYSSTTTTTTTTTTEDGNSYNKSSDKDNKNPFLMD